MTHIIYYYRYSSLHMSFLCFQAYRFRASHASAAATQALKSPLLLPSRIRSLKFGEDSSPAEGAATEKGANEEEEEEEEVEEEVEAVDEVGETEVEYVLMEFCFTRAALSSCPAFSNILTIVNTNT